MNNTNNPPKIDALFRAGITNGNITTKTIRSILVTSVLLADPKTPTGSSTRVWMDCTAVYGICHIGSYNANAAFFGDYHI